MLRSSPPAPSQLSFATQSDKTREQKAHQAHSHLRFIRLGWKGGGRKRVCWKTPVGKRTTPLPANKSCPEERQKRLRKLAYLLALLKKEENKDAGRGGNKAAQTRSGGRQTRRCEEGRASERETDGARELSGTERKGRKRRARSSAAAGTSPRRLAKKSRAAAQAPPAFSRTFSLPRFPPQALCSPFHRSRFPWSSPHPSPSPPVPSPRLCFRLPGLPPTPLRAAPLESPADLANLWLL